MSIAQGTASTYNPNLIAQFSNGSKFIFQHKPPFSARRVPGSFQLSLSGIDRSAALVAVTIISQVGLLCLLLCALSYSTPVTVTVFTWLLCRHAQG
jgi:hypothetical protein